MKIDDENDYVAIRHGDVTVRYVVKPEGKNHGYHMYDYVCSEICI